MRISNLQFAKGSIVYANFSGDENSYLNGRPLLIVSNYIPIFSSVWAVPITTSLDKPGIKCLIWNYHTNAPMGGAQCSVIKLHEIISISTGNIHSCIGTMDPIIMKKVDEAIQYYLGYSDAIPQFMEDCEKDNVPQYVKLSETFYDRNQRVSIKYERDEIIHRQLQSIPEFTENSKKRVFDYGEEMTINSVQSRQENDISTFNEIPLQTAIDIWNSGEKLNVPKLLCNDISWVNKNIPERDIAMVISRNVSLVEIKDRYDLKNERNARMLRDSIFKCAVSRFRCRCSCKTIDHIDILVYIILNKFADTCDVMKNYVTSGISISQKLIDAVTEYYCMYFTSRQWNGVSSDSIIRILEKS